MFMRVLTIAAAIVFIFTFSTALAGAAGDRNARASIERQVIHVRGVPFFPVMLIDQCDAGVASLTSIGVGDAPKKGSLFLISGRLGEAAA